MSIYCKVLNALLGLERYIVLGLLLIAVLGCISVGNFFGALVSAILAVGLNAYYMVLMKRKRESVGDGSGTDNDTTSAATLKAEGLAKKDQENIQNLSAARA